VLKLVMFHTVAHLFHSEAITFISVGIRSNQLRGKKWNNRALCVILVLRSTLMSFTVSDIQIYLFIVLLYLRPLVLSSLKRLQVPLFYSSNDLTTMRPSY
jgi:hypothetical protein